MSDESTHGIERRELPQKTAGWIGGADALIPRFQGVEGRGLPGGHSLQESTPDETLAELRAFLRA